LIERVNSAPGTVQSCLGGTTARLNGSRFFFLDADTLANARQAAGPRLKAGVTKWFGS